MNYMSLSRQLLSQEEQNEMESSIELLENGDYQGFYEKNKDIIRNILFIEELEEFLDFSGENELDRECFSFAFLCAKKYGIQIGGYEDDLTDTLTAFFEEKELRYPEISRIIESLWQGISAAHGRVTIFPFICKNPAYASKEK